MRFLIRILSLLCCRLSDQTWEEGRCIWGVFKGRTETEETDFEEKQRAIHSGCVLGSWEGCGRGLYPVMLRNGIFAATSINKDATVTSNCGHHGSWAGEPWGSSERRECLQSSTHQTAVTLSGVRLEELRMWKQDTGPRPLRCIWKEWFQRARLLHLSILLYIEKPLNSLIWVIGFSLINNKLLMFRLPALCCKASTWPDSALYHLNFSQSYLRLCLLVWAPKNSHQIKHNSQLLGCEYFLNPPYPKTYTGFFFFFFKQRTQFGFTLRDQKSRVIPVETENWLATHTY